jgi:transcriptional regulator with XRE-family HTH domain
VTSLQALRVARNLSREALAAAAGVSPRTIYGIEVEGARPHRATRQVIAQALGCDPAALVGSHNDAEPAANGLGSKEADRDGPRTE